MKIYGDGHFLPTGSHQPPQAGVTVLTLRGDCEQIPWEAVPFPVFSLQYRLVFEAAHISRIHVY